MFENRINLVSFMREHGAIRILFKCLAENDNCKQQIYLGGSFEALNQLPFGEVIPDNIHGQTPNFKASLNFFWIDDDGGLNFAPRAQLILYPRYPEVRLSGFLQGCRAAPRDHLQPVLPGERSHNNRKDGRVLIFGICSDGKILASLSLAGTALSNELIQLDDGNHLFSQIDIPQNQNTRTALIEVLSSIHGRGWIPGTRMDANGITIPYNARNAGGYTLEACLGIIPNGRAEPDWMGWEVKAFAGRKITLMTPEPDGGYYAENRVDGFVRKYGQLGRAGDLYFTGIHKCGRIQTKTHMNMILDGYDADRNRIVRVDGGLTLIDADGESAAIWTYAKLLEHWGRKHALAVYVPYTRLFANDINNYLYGTPIKIGEGTDFSKFLQAFYRGLIVYDPASKIFTNERGNAQTKARNQFRINVGHLNELYDSFSSEQLR